MDVKLILTWGDDAEIIEDARMSTDGNFRGWPADERLLGYLANNGHVSPFQGSGAKFEVHCPIFVARQIMRHSSMAFNEHSARYSTLPMEFYEPIWRHQAVKNTQGSGGLLEEMASGAATSAWLSAIDQAEASYKKLLALGVSREQARSVLPVCVYTKFRMTGSIRSWVHFFKARIHPHAQEDTRWLASDMLELLRPVFPRSMRMFDL